MRGFELWRGPSRLDGAPVVALLSHSTTNRKTGPMMQAWIMRADVDPRDAVTSGADASICGSCPFGPGRPEGTARSCYVRPSRGPAQVWHAWRSGHYRIAPPSDYRAIARGQAIRIGAYGDPAAVPPGVWHGLLGTAATWTAYTRQWSAGFALSDIAMASTRNNDESDRAAANGWRVYQATEPGAKRREGFAVCPFVSSGGLGSIGAIQCRACGLCNGTAAGHRTHIQAPIHGVAHRSALVVVGGPR